jgi:hypothetical protein
MDDLKAILESRTPLYAKANVTVSTSGKTEKQVLNALLARIPSGSGTDSASPQHADARREPRKQLDDPPHGL